jgi:hypothetical protein
MVVSDSFFFVGKAEISDGLAVFDCYEKCPRINPSYYKGEVPTSTAKGSG